jgi:hypothetical protein
LHSIPEVRESYIALGNTTFAGEKMGELLVAMSNPECLVNGIRKPSTLAYLLQQNRTLIAAVISDDTTRRERVSQRNKSSDLDLSYEAFLADEHRENSYPHAQNTDLLIAFADLQIDNTRMPLDRFIDRGKHLLNEAHRNILHQPETIDHIDAYGYRHFVRGIIQNEHNEILLLYDTAKGRYLLP